LRWDDLQLLRLIDQLELNEPGTLSRGLDLMERAARDQDRKLDYQRDVAPFAWELRLANHGGYLVWEDLLSLGSQPADPDRDPHFWLQQITQIRLTLAGRGRARGQVIVLPLPDPSQDDNRLIAGLTLELVARTIADTYTGSQLAQFFTDSGVPSGYISDDIGEDRQAWVLSVLEKLHNGGSEARRELRSFIGRYLSNQLGEPPNDRVRRTILARLGQQGWHVHEGILVIGERSPAEPGVLTPLSRDSRIAALHPKIRQVASKYLDSNLMSVAVFEALKTISVRVKEMSGLDIDGYDLMAKSFRDDNPPIELDDLTSQSGKSVHAGFRYLFMGAVLALRNPDAHQVFADMSDEEGFEELGLASMLMRRLDGATVNRKQL
jgi:uncharacterized protein (TIGR02391 family)